MKRASKQIVTLMVMMFLSYGILLSNGLAQGTPQEEARNILFRMLDGHERLSASDQLMRLGDIVTYAESTEESVTYFALVQQKNGSSALTVFQDDNGIVTRTEFAENYLPSLPDGDLAFQRTKDGRLELRYTERHEGEAWDTRVVRTSLRDDLWGADWKGVEIDYIQQMNGQQILTTLSQDTSLFHFHTVNEITSSATDTYITDLPIGLNIYSLCIDDVPYSYDDAVKRYGAYVKGREKIADIDPSSLSQGKLQAIELWGYQDGDKVYVDFMSVQKKDGTSQWIPFQKTRWFGNENHLRYEDANFDGNMDLLICKDFMSNGLAYTYFIWNDALSSFERDDLFSALPEFPIFDYDSNQIHFIFKYTTYREEMTFVVEDGRPKLIERLKYDVPKP